MKSENADHPLFKAGVATERARISQILFQAGVKLDQNVRFAINQDVEAESSSQKPPTTSGRVSPSSNQRSKHPWGPITKRINEEREADVSEPFGAPADEPRR